MDLIRQEQIERFDRLKADYADPYYGGDKRALKRDIDELRREIAAWTHPGESAQGFDWRVEFAEVFVPQEPMMTIGGAMNFGQELAEQPQPGGFDIVLANPPYVRQELIRERKPTLQKVFPEVYTGTADLYCYFYARALQLLRPGGMLSFISSNKWFRAAYGANLRRHIAETCRVLSITDFGDLPVFQNATAYPMIFIAEKTPLNPLASGGEAGHRLSLRAGGDSAKRRDGGGVLFTQVRSLEPPYPDVLALIRRDGSRLPADALNGANWTLTDSATADRLRKMERAGVPLGEYVEGKIYRGVLTGFNTAFVINGAKRAELIAQDPKSAEIIKPLVVGKDIRRWVVAKKDKWIIVTKIGVDIRRYPAILEHLKRWQTELETRWDRGEHWWELRACAYYTQFAKPKIVFPDIAKETRFAFDRTGAYLGNTAYIMPVNDLYLLGVLNSEAVVEFYIELSAQVRGGYLRFIRQYVEQIPIPAASAADRAAIAALVQKCLEARGVGCEAWEREINERVAALYGL